MESSCAVVEGLTVEDEKGGSFFPLDDLSRAIASHKESFPTIAWDVESVSRRCSTSSSASHSSSESSVFPDDDGDFASHTNKTPIRSRTMVRCVSIANDLSLMFPTQHDGS